MHLRDAVQRGQTQGLFLLPGGRPLLLGAGGSGAGSVSSAVSSGIVGNLAGIVGDLVEGCGAIGSGAEVGRVCWGACCTGAGASTATGTNF